MKIIEALEEALKNEQRLGDNSFDLDHEQLNDFFYYQAEQKLSFPTKPNQSHEVLEISSSSPQDSNSVKTVDVKEVKLIQHSVPPVITKHLEVKAPIVDPARKLNVKQEESFEEIEDLSVEIDIKTLDLSTLREKALSCTKCNISFKDPHELKKTKLFFIFDGSLIKGELQDPLAGPSGEFFLKMLAAMKIDIEDIYIAKIHRCPRTSELKEQSAAVLQQINLLKPDACIVCSPSIIREISNFESINQCRGQWLSWEGIKIMPTYSPAFLMRSENVYGKAKKKEAWADLQLVMNELKL
ncbi:uracil-DNA glycosylase family protein [Lentisphaera profundi]|uniref:Uracil-DNA glycosylase family protein n=1 Tax=Lentisphaera profundi TaxID=1658616 RepID=A0ABY7VTX8_9BACT|nr:uracil-DNA glycosylase family protein [Lentisphaera profundi]WDE97502.1 uracil-DNA glycosylase family protein [Lentisphaera profundi]